MSRLRTIKSAPADGFIDYNDTSTTTTPLVLAADTWVNVPNDGLGAFSNSASAPAGITQLMDTSNGKIDPTQLKIGSHILIRNDIRVTPAVNQGFLQFRYELGTGGNIYHLTHMIGVLGNGGGLEYDLEFLDFIYMGDENTRGNPITLQINSSEQATCINLGCVIEATV